MAGTQQAMARLMRHRIAQEKIERQPESRSLLPDRWYEHARIVAALRRYDGVTQRYRLVMVGAAGFTRFEPNHDFVGLHPCFASGRGRLCQRPPAVEPD